VKFELFHQFNTEMKKMCLPSLLPVLFAFGLGSCSHSTEPFSPQQYLGVTMSDGFIHHAFAQEARFMDDSCMVLEAHVDSVFYVMMIKDGTVPGMYAHDSGVSIRAYSLFNSYLKDSGSVGLTQSTIQVARESLAQHSSIRCSTPVCM
jgi:hypothetical protein